MFVCVRLDCWTEQIVFNKLDEPTHREVSKAMLSIQTLQSLSLNGFYEISKTSRLKILYSTEGAASPTLNRIWKPWFKFLQ